MEPDWKATVWTQLGAAIDSLENALNACPESLWGDRSRFPEYWYLVYHTLFFLDFYMSDSQEGFAPPEPFTMSEMDPSGVLPDRVYSQEELRCYLEHGREKTRARIAAMTPKKAHAIRRFGKREYDELEMLLYTMRHVQHHTAQLNLILRQVTDSAPEWVARAKRGLSGTGEGV